MCFRVFEGAEQRKIRCSGFSAPVLGYSSLGIMGIRLSLGGSRLLGWDIVSLGISAPGFKVFKGLGYTAGNYFVLGLFCFGGILFLI